MLAAVFDHIVARTICRHLIKNGVRLPSPRCRLPTRSPQFEELAAFGADAGTHASHTFLRSRACLGIAGHTSTRPMWRFVLGGGAEKFNAAMETAWGARVGDVGAVGGGSCCELHKWLSVANLSLVHPLHRPVRDGGAVERPTRCMWPLNKSGDPSLISA